VGDAVAAYPPVRDPGQGTRAAGADHQQVTGAAGCVDQDRLAALSIKAELGVPSTLGSGRPGQNEVSRRGGCGCPQGRFRLASRNSAA
jgi:hypothetical protein